MKFLILSLAALLAACSPNVYVVDENGSPLEDVRIIPLSRSLQHKAVFTNAKGEAKVTQDMPYVTGLHVAKPGYVIPPEVNFDLPKPIRLVLKKLPPG